jgi:hypothetical protein
MFQVLNKEKPLSSFLPFIVLPKKASGPKKTKKIILSKL